LVFNAIWISMILTKMYVDTYLMTSYTQNMLNIYDNK